MKHLTRELSQRLAELPTLRALEIKAGEWRPCTAWFAKHNVGGRYYSVRNHGDALYVFRIQ
jgi:hypothetical protein